MKTCTFSGRSDTVPVKTEQRAKARAMQIIADLEGTTRGPYAGYVGYFSFKSA
jgi:hypothetical protein